MLGKIDKILDTDKPILINGWGKVKKLYPNQKITNKQISDNIFWTFSEKEKRVENENDINKFKKYCLNLLEKNYRYYFLNPFDLSFWNVKKIIHRINSIENGKFYYFDGKHFFILIENFIFGINTDFLEYSKMKENKIKKWLNSKNFKIIENSKIFTKEEMNNKKYLIPILGKENYEEEFIIGYIFE